MRFGFSGALPGPPTLVDVNFEDMIGMTRVTLTEPGLVSALCVWYSGKTTGPDVTQVGKLLLYSSNGAGTRPLNLLAHTIEGTANKSDPFRAVDLPLDPVYGAGVLLAAGTYWIGIMVGLQVGQGEWEIHGTGAGTGTGIRSVPYVYGAGVPPAVFPAGGVNTTNFAGVAAFYIQQPRAATGAVCGTFLCGSGVISGQFTNHFNQAALRLKGGAFDTRVIADLEQVILGKPKILLTARSFLVRTGSTPDINKAKLTLKGKTFRAVGPTQVKQNAAILRMKGKAYVLALSSTPQISKPQLILRGGKIRKVGKAGLIPTTPVTEILVPTVGVTRVLTPTAPDARILIPTEERFL